MKERARFSVPVLFARSVSVILSSSSERAGSAVSGWGATFLLVFLMRSGRASISTAGRPKLCSLHGLEFVNHQNS